MKRELQERFFSLFRLGGILDTSISIIKRKNDLNFSPQTKPLDDRSLRLTDQQSKSLDERYKKLGDTSLYPPNLIHLLINEIEDKYLGLPKERDKRAYLLSIITEFKVISDIIYHDLYYKNSHEDTLTSLRESREVWLKADNKEEASRQINAIDNYFHKYSEREIRAKAISEYFWGFSQMKYDESLIENKAFSLCWHLQHQFSNMFDALCLRYGLDLLKLQSECNVYLIHSHDLSLLQHYIGSLELARKYLDEIKKDDQQQEQLDNETTQVRHTVKTFADLFETPYLKHSDKFVDILKSSDLPDGLETVLSEDNKWIGNRQVAMVFYKELLNLGIVKKAPNATVGSLFESHFKNLNKSFSSQKPGSIANDYKDYFNKEINLIRTKVT